MRQQVSIELVPTGAIFAFTKNAYQEYILHLKSPQGSGYRVEYYSVRGTDDITEDWFEKDRKVWVLY